MTDPKRLRELAEKATKGPWHTSEASVYQTAHFTRDIWVVCSSPAYGTHDNWLNDRDFIAACHPQAILALLDRLDSARVIIEKSYGCCDCAMPLSKAWLDANGEGM